MCLLQVCLLTIWAYTYRFEIKCRSMVGWSLFVCIFVIFFVSFYCLPIFSGQFTDTYLLFSFSFPHFLVVSSVRYIELTFMSAFQCTLKQLLVSYHIVSCRMLCGWEGNHGSGVETNSLKSVTPGQCRCSNLAVPMTAEGTPFSGSMNTALCDFWYAAPCTGWNDVTESMVTICSLLWHNVWS